jgi:hypothetical protein
MVVHMVIKNANKPQSSRESTPSSASSTTGGPVTLPNMAPSAAGQQGQLGAMLNNPGGMGAMLNNPMVRDMLNSPYMEK